MEPSLAFQHASSTATRLEQHLEQVGMAALCLKCGGSRVAVGFMLLRSVRGILGDSVEPSLAFQHASSTAARFEQHLEQVGSY